MLSSCCVLEQVPLSCISACSTWKTSRLDYKVDDGDLKQQLKQINFRAFKQ